MDNQNNSQQLRPSQDLQPGQRITFRGFNGTVIVSKFPYNPYPIAVKLDDIDWTYCFTKDGRFYADGDVELFRLEESDKPEQEEAATTTNHPSQDLEAHVWATLELIKGYYNLSDSESTRMAGWLTRLYNAGYNKGREGSHRHTIIQTFNKILICEKLF